MSKKDAIGKSLSLKRLVASRRPKVGKQHYPYRLLALDPGETTGWSFFIGTELQQFGAVSGITNSKTGQHQLEDAMLTLDKLITELNPDTILIEKFRLYPWRAQNQTWSTFPTVEIIGVIRFLAKKLNKTLVEQSASTAKGFFDDNTLRRINLYRSNRHSRDSIRHACYFLTFSRK